MTLRVFLCLTVFITCYILGGAYIFILLEAKPADENVSATNDGTNISSTQFFQDFLATHPSVTASDLKRFLFSVVAVQGGRIVVDNVTVSISSETRGRSSQPLWTFDSAVLFALTIVTTVGYGHLTPTTTASKLFCVLYTLVGVPAGAAQLACTGQHLRTRLVALHRSKPWYPKDKNKDQMIKSAVVLGLGTVLMLCAPSVLWMLTEGWDYATALYFNTITLTTVGFGDYIAGMAENDWAPYYRIGLGLWLLVGLSWVALLISEIGDIYLHRIGKHVGNRKVDRNPKTEDENTTDHIRDETGTLSRGNLAKLTES